MERRNKKIGARVTENEKLFIDRQASSLFMTETEYVLACCMDKNTYLSVKEKTKEKIKLPDGTKKEARIEFRLSQKEKMLLEEKASTAKMDLSKFILSCCSKKQIIVIEDIKQFITELNKVGGNLNQIALLCHQGLIAAPNLEEIRACLKSIYIELVRISTDLRKDKRK